MALELGKVGVWSLTMEQIPTSRAKEVAAELEELGYGAVWLPEIAGRDVFVHLTHLLSATSRIVGATGIASIWARDAVAMAASANALTEAFPERFLLGLGVSHHNLVEGLRGHVYEKPYSAMQVYLDALDKAPYSGYRPETPVHRVLGALGPRMLRLSAERAEGAHPYLTTPEHTARARDLVGPDALLCVEQKVLLETDASTARERLRPGLKPYVSLPNYQRNLRTLGFGDDDFVDGGSDRLVDAVCAHGTVEDAVARVRAHLDAGATHVCIQAMGNDRRDVPMAEWRELAPALTSLS